MPPRRGSPPPLLNQQLLIIIVPVTALLILFIAVPSFLSIASHKIRPTTVRKSWDSLSVFLVLFAILCGVFARKNEDESAANSEDSSNISRNVSRAVHGNKPHDSSVSEDMRWFDRFAEEKIQAFTASPLFGTSAAGGSGTGLRRLKRSSSSYPDLIKQESLWESGDVDRFRFFDDFDITKYRSAVSSSASEYSNHRKQQPSTVTEDSNVKDIPVDTFVVRSSPPRPPPSRSPTPPPPPPTPPPPPPVTDHKHRRTYTAVPRKEIEEKRIENDHDSRCTTNVKSSPQAPPPPPPPPPPLPPSAEKQYVKSERKKTNAAKEIKMVLASLYNQRKRKKQQKAKTQRDETVQVPPEHPSFNRPPPSPAPPPPPPPPPSPSVFHNLFKKGGKSKRIHSFTAPPPPPPPPAPPRRSSKGKIQVSPPPAPPTPPPEPYRRRNSTNLGRPPLPTKVNSFYEENVNSGGQSPLVPMPPPPPPPPFRVPGFKFAVKGDYVKVRSTHSSRCGSPDLDDIDKDSTIETVNSVDGEDRRSGSGGPVFCPSPDVDVKADNFIARLRGEWRLEKINSLKEKGIMGLSPFPGP